ncbi:MAG: NADH-quinone oxidoreductase subunit L [Leptolinea sp.]|jgi:NADH-quinone oxidoreductase subunit L|nr:NADH-quinone oxidoreductase subunit L [Leptolinea sp.]
MLFSETLIDPTFSLVSWVVWFPLGGIVINLLFGRRLGERFAAAAACLAAAGSFIISVLLALALARHSEGATIPLLEWIHTGALQIDWTFRVDTLSVTMMLVVSGVGTLIHIYAAGYMHYSVRVDGDPGRYSRFFVYFNLFILAMMLLVSADNYLMLFVGWEGVGLCSYLLIGFWYEKGIDGIANARAAKKAFLVNRIGDFGLLIALFLMFWNFGSLQFDPVFNRAPEIAAAVPGVLLAITLFMLLGVAGKSAQLPLFVWLPDAMAGPTPVSALIHAATMVTAGVYLVARSHVLYELVPAAQNTVMWVGALTALFAASIAIAQNDIKKILAYSTISQLGFMITAVGMGAFTAGMFHLITHAFFKALLFLGAGSVILGMEGARKLDETNSYGDPRHTHTDPQDITLMGGLRDKMPVTYRVYLIGALALAGIAPLAGFFSKDEILAAASRTSPVVFLILLAAAFLTAFYMGRQVWLVFFGKPRSASAQHARENIPVITIPLVLLAVLAALGGVLNIPGSYYLESWLEHTLGKGIETVFNPVIALTSLLVALAGLFATWLIYGRWEAKTGEIDPLAGRLGVLYTCVKNKWWVDELYHAVFVRPFQRLAQICAEPVDQGWIDGIPVGLSALTKAVSFSLRGLENGYVRTYALFILAGLVLIFAYLILR